jgi:uncharacterized protein with PIN domain
MENPDTLRSWRVMRLACDRAFGRYCRRSFTDCRTDNRWRSLCVAFAFVSVAHSPALAQITDPALDFEIQTRMAFGASRSAAMTGIVVEEQKRSQAMIAQLQREIDALRQATPTADEIATDLDRRAEERKLRRELERVEAELRARERQITEAQQKQQRLDAIFARGKNAPKLLRWSEGGGVMKRGDQVVRVGGKVTEVAPQWGINRDGVWIVGRSEQVYAVPKEDFVWVFPTRRASMDVVEPDPPAMTDQEWQAAAKASAQRAMQAFPFLSKDGPERDALRQFISQQQNVEEFAFLFSLSRWPELIVEEFGRTNGWTSALFRSD